MRDGVLDSSAKQTLWIAAFVIAALLIVALGFFQYQAEEHRVKAEQTDGLTAIGSLKADQIAEWRKERLSDVTRFAQGPTLTRAVDKDDHEDLRIILNLNRKNRFYEEALLVSRDLLLLGSATEKPLPLTEVSRKTIAKVLASQAPALSDFYLGIDGTVHIDVAAPVYSVTNTVTSVLILRCAASDYLYPLLQTWPLPSISAETLLVRKEDDSVLFLNKLRHQTHSAMTLKLPLTRTELPAIQALLGKQGVLQGTDYRGTPVFADVRPIPGSDWFLITKEDRHELLAPVRRRAAVIGGFVFLGLLLAAAATELGLRNRQALLYRTLYKTEQTQREAVEKFRTILYSIGDGVITTNDKGRVCQMNPVAEHLTGWKEAEAEGLPLEDIFRIINEETREPVKSPVWRVLNEGQIVGLANHTTLLSRDGNEYPITDSGAPIRDDQGNVVGVVLVFRDQSSERAAHKALSLSESRLSLLMNNFPGIVYRCGLDTYWTMEFISQGCKELTGYDVAALLDNTVLSFFDLIHPDDRQSVWDTIDAAVKRGESFTLEYRIITADGTEKWVWERGCAIRNPEGKGESLEGFIHDITQRKQADAEQSQFQEQLNQAQKIEAIGRLAGGVAHDFNNMLSVIIGNTELIDTKLGADAPVHAELAEILKAVKHSAALVKQLLGFASKQLMTPRMLDLNDTVGGMCDMLRSLISERITLEWEPSYPLWPVLLDPAQLEQILINLIVNARQAITGSGRITLSTRTVRHQDSGDGMPQAIPLGDYVLLSVSDSGCGMDAATQAQVFEPFFTTKTGGLGTGLGLPTVYGIVKQNKGYIHINSQPGQGSCFQIYLPPHLSQKQPGTEPQDVPVVPVPQAPPLPALVPKAKAVILLVEDEPAVLALTATLLKLIGYTVIKANGPKEALRQVREKAGETIDLLLTDVVMPEMSGLALWEQLVRDRPTLKSLFMSGYTADIIAHHGMLNAQIPFLQKPFTREALAEKVREVLAS